MAVSFFELLIIAGAGLVVVVIAALVLAGRKKGD